MLKIVRGTGKNRSPGKVDMIHHKEPFKKSDSPHQKLEVGPMVQCKGHLRAPYGSNLPPYFLHSFVCGTRFVRLLFSTFSLFQNYPFSDLTPNYHGRPSIRDHFGSWICSILPYVSKISYWNTCTSKEYFFEFSRQIDQFIRDCHIVQVSHNNTCTCIIMILCSFNLMIDLLDATQYRNRFLYLTVGHTSNENFILIWSKYTSTLLCRSLSKCFQNHARFATLMFLHKHLILFYQCMLTGYIIILKICSRTCLDGGEKVAQWWQARHMGDETVGLLEEEMQLLPE